MAIKVTDDLVGTARLSGSGGGSLTQHQMAQAPNAVSSGTENKVKMTKHISPNGFVYFDVNKSPSPLSVDFGPITEIVCKNMLSESYDLEKIRSMPHLDIPLEGPTGWRERFRKFDRKPWEK